MTQGIYESISINVTRILHLAYQLAMVHIGDNDILGSLAKELVNKIDTMYPNIENLPNDSDDPKPDS